MEIWMLFGCVLLAFLIWFFAFTPYPFVFALRRQKDEVREKGPEGIKQLEASLIIKRNLVYLSRFPNATYDLYMDPSQTVKRFLIWVHGGSFIAGTSAGAKNFACLQASQGTCVCAINYALAPAYAFPKQTVQLDEFMQYAIDEILPKYTKEAVPCYLGGDSAGANIVSMYACIRTKEALARQLQLQMQCTKEIAGLLLFCGPYDFSEDLQQPEWNAFRKFFQYLGWSYLGKKKWYKTQLPNLASPMHHVTSAYPPSYICDGKKTSFMWQGIKFADVLKAQNVTVDTRFYEHMSHEFQFDYVKNKVEAMQVFHDSMTFFSRIERM